MNNIVRKRRYIDGWRIGENESWLSDMAASGLHLKKFGIMFAGFESGEPKPYRYRIDFSSKAEDISYEQRELYAESGWEYVCKSGGMRIFRSPEAINAPELHTDPAEQAYTLKQLEQKLTSNGIVISLLILGAFCMLFFAVFYGKTPMLRFVEGGLLNMPFLFLLDIYIMYSAIDAAISMKKLVSSLRDGNGINHKADWKKYFRISRAVLIILWIMMPFAIALPIAQIALRSTEALPLVKDNQMHIRLADIEGVTLERKEGWNIEDVDWLNSITYTWSPYAPIMLELNEHGIIADKLWYDGSGTYSPSLSYKLYKLSLPFLADSLISDLCKFYEDYGRYPIFEVNDYSEFDKLYIRSEGISHEVFASKGDMVISVRYYGEQEIETVIGVVINAVIERSNGS